MTPDTADSFESLKARLDEIVDAVSDDTLPLDDALALYEEAVALGLRASDLLEENISARDAEEAAADALDDAEETVAADGVEAAVPAGDGADVPVEVALAEAVDLPAANEGNVQ